MADYEQNERLRVLIEDVFKVSPVAFAKKYNDTKAVKTYNILSKRNGISSKMLEEILHAYPEISKVWLLTGEGEKFKSIEECKGQQVPSIVIPNESATFTVAKDGVNERINLILEKCGYKSKRAFSLKLGISQTSFNDIMNGAEPKFSTLKKILLAEPLINAEWLLTGKGEMFKDSAACKEQLATPIVMSNESAAFAAKEERFLVIIESQQRTIENLSEAAKKMAALQESRADYAAAK
jgi:hypothetical protein